MFGSDREGLGIGLGIGIGIRIADLNLTPCIKQIVMKSDGGTHL